MDAVAKTKGFDTSKITSAAVGRAQDALSQAEGHVADLLDRADNKLAGNGMYFEGGHFYNLQGKATQKVNIDILQLYRAVASYRYTAIGAPTSSRLPAQHCTVHFYLLGVALSRLHGRCGSVRYLVCQE